MVPKRVDANQAEIVADLRKAGATVLHLHEMGKGCPDLLVGFRDMNYLIEIKSEGGQFTMPQYEWFALWNGQANVARTSEEALKIIGAIA